MASPSTICPSSATSVPRKYASTIVIQKLLCRTRNRTIVMRSSSRAHIGSVATDIDIGMAVLSRIARKYSLARPSVSVAIR